MRYTHAMAKDKLALVQSMAERAGVRHVNYSGGTYSGMYIYRANGTSQLVATLDDGSTGVTDDISQARGAREVCLALAGMAQALESVARQAEYSARH